MFKKLLLILVSFFYSQFDQHESGSWIAEFGMDKLRILVRSIVGVVIGLILFSAGLNLVLTDLQQQAMHQQQFSISAISILGMALILLFSIGIWIGFRRSTWGLEPLRREPSEPQPADNSLIATAVSALIMDFVEERKQQRQTAEQNSPIFSK